MADNIFTTGGSRVFIGTTMSVVVPEEQSTVNDLAVQTAMELDTFTEIEEVEDLGEFGDEWRSTEQMSLKTSRVRRLKTVKDAGQVELLLARLAQDAGQQALKAAFNAKVNYNFKIVLDDAPGIDSDDTPTVIYFRGMVMTARGRFGTAEDVLRRTMAVAVNTRDVEIPAASGA